MGYIIGFITEPEFSLLLDFQLRKYNKDIIDYIIEGKTSDDNNTYSI